MMSCLRAPILVALFALASGVRPDCKKEKSLTAGGRWRASKAALFQKGALARALAASGRPDPTCKTGILSMNAGAQAAGQPQACCPAYCGECSDYPACASVNGQNSGNACCATRVVKMSCESGNAQANICIPACADGVPPCVMPEGKVFKPPPMTSAAEDCNEAVPEWMATAESGVKQAKGGEASWKKLEKTGKIFTLAQRK